MKKGQFDFESFSLGIITAISVAGWLFCLAH